MACTAPLVVPPALGRGRTGALFSRKASSVRWVSTSSRVTSAKADGRVGGQSRGSDKTALKRFRVRSAEDPGAPRQGVTVTAIAEPAVTNQEVASTPAPAPRAPPPPAKTSLEISEDAPAAPPQPKRAPVHKDLLQAVVMAGGPSTGNPLTEYECAASLKFAATNRLIDFPLANIINSGMKRAFVLTQFNSYTLNQHVHAAYPPEVFGFGSDGYVDVLPSFQTIDDQGWSMGSADCVRRHYKAGALRGPGFVPAPEAYLILSGEALYRMDYGQMLKTHNETGADITIGTARRRLSELDVTNLGMVGIEENADGTFQGGKVTRFLEKPDKKALEAVAVCYEGAEFLSDCDVHVNMGVYIFSKRAMDSLLGRIDCVTLDPESEERLDFGKNILPMAVQHGFSVVAHQHDGYWQPIRNLREWYDANLALCVEAEGPFAYSAASMIDHENPLHSVPRCLPPARFTGKVEMTNSIVSEGVLVGGGSSVTNSVLGPCVVLGENTTIIECIFIGHQETGYLHGDGAADVGSGSVLRNCVVHSDVVIGENCFLTNENGEKDKNGLDINRVTVDPETGKGYVIQDGIIVFMPGTVVAAGTVI